MGLDPPPLNIIMTVERNKISLEMPPKVTTLTTYQVSLKSVHFTKLCKLQFDNLYFP